MSVRKHLYLVTEHDEEGRIGGVKITDQRLASGEKNKETPITALDENEGGFVHVGKQVHLGYLDFEGEDEYKDADFADVLQRKAREVDRHWVKKAGIEGVVYDGVEA